jgi:uncharacterized protein YjbJ (UPF0337 family)
LVGAAIGVRLQQDPTVRGADRCGRKEANSMSTDDKIGNKAEELKGKAKETAGRATDDPALTTEGKTDQVKGNLKQAGEKVKDAFKDN